MQQLVITGKKLAELRTVPDPRVQGSFALVKIHSAPMCTEVKGYVDGAACDCLGHEAAGEVVEIAGPAKVRVGDRVAVMPQYPCGVCDLCRTGDYIHCEANVNPLALCGSETGKATYAQYLVKQDWLLLPLPDGVSYDHGAMACCGLGPTFGAMERMGVVAGDTILITGLGPVGLGGVLNAVYRGARVIGVESSPYRAALARSLGAAEVVDPRDPDALARIRDLAGGRGVDKAIDCTAVPAAQQLAISAARRRGQVAFIGWGGRIEMENMVPGGLTLIGSWHWNLNLAPRMMRLIRDCPGEIDKLITHRYPLAEFGQAWETQISGQCGKVILHPWESK